MESTELNRVEECITRASSDHLFSMEAPEEADIYGDPPASPRVGSDYQVALLPLKAEEYSQLTQGTVDVYRQVDVDYKFGLGLAIPISWHPRKIYDIKDEEKEISDAKARVGIDKSGLRGLGNTEMTHNPDSSYPSAFTDEDPSYHGLYLKSTSTSTSISELVYETYDKAYMRSISQVNDPAVKYGALLEMQPQNPNHYTPLPGTLGISWTNDEIESFLLGLYIFGKNLLLIRKFMEVKEMGELLPFYYGKFYRSDAHRRWSECRKSKSRKCIQGQRIFTCWRQQELLSRLLPNLSEESQIALREVTRTFTEGTTTFEEYVFTMKAIVGMKALVEAIAIGKGKHDLTGNALDPSRSNTALPTRPDIPAGKACSSLTSEEIIKFLTGGFRLSKTRSNDIFWEAVWPRLLARGWHSEQPKNQSSATSKQNLVFLIPGVKKFSRRKLKKSYHYFDSVTDVLNKVASNPKLLELVEVEGNKGSSIGSDANDWVADTTLDHNCPTDHECHSYSHGGISGFTSDLIKFTIVDTSLVQGEAPFKIRELRNLPMDSSCEQPLKSQNHAPHSSSDDSDSDSSEEKQDSVDMPLVYEESLAGVPESDCKTAESTMFEKVMQSDYSDHALIVPKRRRINKKESDSPHHNLPDGQPSFDIYHQFIHKVKTRKPVYMSPVSKRRRLTACKNSRAAGISSFPRDHPVKQEAIFESLNGCDTIASVSEKYPVKKCSSFFGKGSPNGSGFHISDGICLDTSLVNEAAFLDEKTQPRVLIDLNIPPDYDATESYNAEVNDSQINQHVNGDMPLEKAQLPGDPRGQEVFNDMDIEQPTKINSRRQSTRSRPPTTRVLESLESGFFSIRRKGRVPKPSHSATAKSSRRPRKTVEASGSLATMNHGNASLQLIDPTVRGEMDDDSRSYTSDTKSFDKLHIESESNGATVTYNFLDRP